MDPPTTPPTRFRPVSAKPISMRRTQKKLEEFLDDFQSRSTASQEGNTAVTVQCRS
ncbi:hypothetical protein BD779DRAFT_628124 [Infundibulicybe gibba]|nr:hypothetical protein BD779DRAFT_628124 [Infundibulicybe gibba]